MIKAVEETGWSYSTALLEIVNQRRTTSDARCVRFPDSLVNNLS
jgi:hypothetical protein